MWACGYLVLCRSMLYEGVICGCCVCVCISGFLKSLDLYETLKYLLFDFNYIIF